MDSNALYRQPALQEMHDPSQEDEREAHAAQWELNYVALDGSIGCMVNGAGLAMGTMDIVKLHGGSPANFLDVGGGATKERVTEAFKIILSDENVKAVLINIFGGIVRCDLIAEGVIGAVEEVGVEVPVVVRLEGNNAALGREVLANSGLNIEAAGYKIGIRNRHAWRFSGPAELTLYPSAKLLVKTEDKDLAAQIAKSHVSEWVKV